MDQLTSDINNFLKRYGIDYCDVCHDLEELVFCPDIIINDVKYHVSMCRSCINKDSPVINFDIIKNNDNTKFDIVSCFAKYLKDNEWSYCVECKQEKHWSWFCKCDEDVESDSDDSGDEEEKSDDEKPQKSNRRQCDEDQSDSEDSDDEDQSDSDDSDDEDQSDSKNSDDEKPQKSNKVKRENVSYDQGDCPCRSNSNKQESSGENESGGLENSDNSSDNKSDNSSDYNKQRTGNPENDLMLINKIIATYKDDGFFVYSCMRCHEPSVIGGHCGC